MLFPTRLKCKISSKLAYPVGAELISSELQGVPQAQSLEIHFYSKYERMETQISPTQSLRSHMREPHSYAAGLEMTQVIRSTCLKHKVKEALTREFLILRIRGMRVAR